MHKVLQEGHPIAVKEAQGNINWLESLTRGVSGDGARGAFADAHDCHGITGIAVGVIRDT